MAKQHLSASTPRYNLSKQKVKFIRNFRQLGNLMFYPKGSNLATSRFFFYKSLLNDNYNSSRGPEYAALASEISAEATAMLENNPLGQLNEEDSRALQILEESIKILKEGIRYEQQNEQKYVQEKLANFKEQFKKSPLKKNKEMQVIQKTLENLDQGFNYTSFINLINILLQGLDNTKAIYEYELNHIKEVNKLYLQAKDKYLNQISGLAKKRRVSDAVERSMLSQASRRFDHAAQKAYLTNHTFNLKKTHNQVEAILRHNMQGTETVDVILARKITEQLKTIFKNKQLLSEIKTLVSQNYNINSWEDTAEEIRGKIVVAITEYMNRNLSKFLKTDIDYSKIATNLEEYLSENQQESFEFNIEGLYPNIGRYGHHLDFFKRNKQLAEDSSSSAQGLYEALVDFRTKINHVDRVSDLTQAQQATRSFFGLQQRNGKYNQLLQFVKRLEDFAKKTSRTNQQLTLETELLASSSAREKGRNSVSIKIQVDEHGKLHIDGDLLDTELFKDFLNFKSFSPTNLKNAIASIKGRISQEIKKDIIAKLADFEKKNKNSAQIEKAIQIALQDLQVSIGGPTFSEMRHSLQETTGANFWSGKLKIKDDTITITVTHPDTEIKLNLMDDALEDLSKDVIQIVEKKRTQFQQDYVTAIEKDMKEISKNHSYTDYNKLTENFFKQIEVRDTYIQKAEQEIAEIESQLSDLENITADEQKELESQLAGQKAFLNELENTLYISSTEKTFNNYQNNLGFVGGSIGSNIVNQIENLNTLFAKAGYELQQSEIDWLINAAINNSSLSIVGRKNEDLITTVLGSLATFALFDEGGAELMVLRNNLQKNIAEPLSTPGIMHLYLVNGIYYPGSFVLQQALDNIETILKEIKSEFKSELISSPRNIQIVSTIKFDDIPNHYFTSSRNRFNTHPWETVSEIAKNKTKLNIVFLAGLLSVIDELMSQLGGINLPQ